MSQPASVETVLEQMEGLLEQETAALRLLDHEGLDQLTGRKEQLMEMLARFPLQERQPHLQKLRAVKDHIFANQVLMIHARDLTQGVFDKLTGSGAEQHEKQGRLLSVRG